MISLRKIFHRRARNQDGFTLIELLVVLGILGLLMALVGTRVIEYFGRAKVEATRIQIATFVTALDLARLDIGRYPNDAEGLATLVTRPAGNARWNGPYLRSNSLPRDSWDRPYVYRVPGRDGRAFDVYSLGADGVEGGEGENRDVGNW